MKNLPEKDNVIQKMNHNDFSGPTFSLSFGGALPGPSAKETVMPSYSIEGVVPVVHPSAYVHPTAVLIGDVWIGPDCYVGPAASLRADFGRIILKQGSNVQDTCVMHAFPGMDTVVEKNGHVGHGAILHGCVVGEDAMVGMNAVVMDEAHIAPRSIVGACAFVKAKFTCEPGSLIVGSPAKVMRSRFVLWQALRRSSHCQKPRRIGPGWTPAVTSPSTSSPNRWFGAGYGEVALRARRP